MNVLKRMAFWLSVMGIWVNIYHCNVYDCCVVALENSEHSEYMRLTLHISKEICGGPTAITPVDKSTHSCYAVPDVYAIAYHILRSQNFTFSNIILKLSTLLLKTTVLAL